MKAKEMKKILAGVGIAGLLSGLPLTGVALGSSGCSSAKGGSGAKGNTTMQTEKAEVEHAGSSSDQKGSMSTTHEENEESMGMSGEEGKTKTAPPGEEHKKQAPTGSSG